MSNPVFFVRSQDINRHWRTPLIHAVSNPLIIVYSAIATSEKAEAASQDAIHSAISLTKKLNACGHSAVFHPRFMTGRLTFSSNRGHDPAARKRKNIRFQLDGPTPACVTDRPTVAAMRIANDTGLIWNIDGILGTRIPLDFPKLHTAGT